MILSTYHEIDKILTREIEIVTFKKKILITLHRSGSETNKYNFLNKESSR